MATFTITTPVNIDSLTGKVGDDVYNINGGFLTIDQHSRYGLNNNTSATMLTVTPSATLGGSVKVEGRYSRLVPFDGASGTVPADGTTIAGASGSGLLVGIYSTTLNAAPTASGGAMPASGYALIKQWNGNAFVDNEALTGITANVCIDHILGTGTDRVGWVEVVTRGSAATNWTMNRLNNPADPVCEGLPYQIGVTDGNRATTYQIPSNGVNQYHAGVFVETGTGTGVYEPYPATVDTMISTNVPTNAAKGKWCNMTTAGLVRFGHDGTNSSGGYCPPSGRKIVIGNIFMTLADSAAKTQNYYQATASSRGRWITTGAGRVDARWTSFNFGFGSMTNGQLINLENCGVVDTMSITNPANAPTITNCVIGSPVGYTTSNLVLSNVTVGLDFINSAIGKSGQSTTANSYGLTATDSALLNFENSRIVHTGARGAITQFSINTSRVDQFDLTDCTTSYGWALSSTTNFSYLNGQFYYSNTPNDSANATYMIAPTTLSTGIVVDGVTIEDGDLPRNGLIGAGSSSANVVLRNIGSRTSVIGTGVADGVDITASRVTTTLTIPKTAHGLATGDIITITRTENAASVARGEFTVTRIDANNFTIPVTNTGATSFKVSYQMGHMARLMLVANNSLVKLQNVHAKSTRSATFGLDNSNSEIYLENITTDFTDDSSVGSTANNLHMHGVSHNPLNQAAASSVYGTHIRSGFTAEIGIPNGSGLSWTRSSTSVTVTHTDHGLYTGQRIQVLYSDNQLGAYSAQIVTVTALTKDTFTFTGSNAGTTSGSVLDYKTSDGTLFIDCNEPNDASTAQFTIIAGTPLFTGAGGLLMGTINDEVEWVTERYITDFDKAENMLPLMLGGTISNYHLTYSIDTGSGYGSYKNAYYERATGSGSAASTTVSVADTTGISAGDYVYGIGIGSGAKVVSITNATDFVVDIANANTVSGTLRFSYLPNITGLTSTGFKVKFRCKTIATNTDAITFMRLFFRSTSTTRDVLYPQDVDTVSFSISGIPSGATIALYDSTDTELKREDNILTGDFEYQYVHSGTDVADVYYVFWHEDYIATKSSPFDLTATDLGVSVTPQTDTVYDSAYDDRYVIDYANKRIIMDTGENTYDVRGAYSKWKADIFNADNFTYDFAFSVIGNVVYNSPKRIPPFTELTNSWKIRPREADHTLTVENGILYATSGADPFVDTTGAYTVRIMYSQPVEVLTVSTGSAVTPGDITDIADAVWDEALSGHTTAGTAGKIVDESLSNTDATQAKVDQL